MSEGGGSGDGSDQGWTLTRESHEWCETHQLGYHPDYYDDCPKCRNERLDTDTDP